MEVTDMSSSAEVQKPVNSVDVHRFLEALVRNRVTAAAGLKSLAEFWQRQGAAFDLGAIIDFPLARDLRKLEEWFGTIWSPKAPPITSDGLWFGIVDLPKGGLDLAAAVLPRHGREPASWDWGNVKYAKPRNASSRLFKTLLSPQGPIADAAVRRLMGVGCAVLVAQHLCHSLRPELGAREPVVAAGFDGGDYFILGTARVNGRIEPLPDEAPRRPRLDLLKGNLFRVTDSGSTARWLLAQPRDGSGREVSRTFALQAKLIEGEGVYDVPVYLKGARSDFCFTLTGIPVLRRAVADLIDQADRGAVQRLPVTIDAAHGEYEILNVLSSVRPLKLLEQSKKTSVPLAELDLGKRRIARVNDALVVTRDLVAILAKAAVGGINFFPLREIDLE
jgi:hypothetical protein